MTMEDSIAWNLEHILHLNVPYLLVEISKEYPMIGTVDVLMAPDGTLVVVDHGIQTIVEPI